MSEFEQTPTQHSDFGADQGELGGGEFGGGLDDEFGMPDAIIEEPPKKKHTGAMVLVLTVGLAVGSLFSMHTLTKVTAASGRNTETERTIEQFLKGMGPEGTGTEQGNALVNDHNEVIRVLTDNYTDHQVDEIKRDPFSLIGGGNNQGEATGARLDQVQRAANRLVLKSVIGGRRPLANINGRIVRLNQVIPIEISAAEGAVKFRVTEITSTSVTVVAVDADIDEPFERTINLNR